MRDCFGRVLYGFVAVFAIWMLPLVAGACGSESFTIHVYGEGYGATPGAATADAAKDFAAEVAAARRQLMEWASRHQCTASCRYKFVGQIEVSGQKSGVEVTTAIGPKFVQPKNGGNYSAVLDKYVDGQSEDLTIAVSCFPLPREKMMQ